MATKKQLTDQLRAEQVARVMALLSDEDVQQTASNVFAYPMVDADGNDQWIKVTITVPSGSRDGDVFDGYAEAKDYAIHVAEAHAKREEAEIKKAQKIARDKAQREAKAQAKAQREAEKAGG